jgi:hypothetical protein
MSEGMVERVARAIAALRSCSLEWGPKQPICASCSNARGYSNDVGCVTLARATIAAMREPTQLMLDHVTAADQRPPFNDKEMRGVWQEMIDAALSEGDG